MNDSTCPTCGRPSPREKWIAALPEMIAKFKPGITRIPNKAPLQPGDTKPDCDGVPVTLQGPDHNLGEATILDGASIYAGANPKNGKGFIQIFHSHGWIDCELSPEQLGALRKAFDEGREKLQRRGEWI